ncbi:hypothetical protein [Amycolatopsis marina]|uniref:hypothetical protein n=1 Tax=Amycolatopsis marina TaxID=490629 RepID=UPI0011604971|nr:hypothetical protein [Amycolatopsis marina]
MNLDRTDRHGPAEVLVAYLRTAGFTVDAGDSPGEYVVTACQNDPMPLRPRVSLPDDLIMEYLDELERTPGATGGLTALSITEVHLEEALSAGVEYRPTTAVGVRRRRGGVEFFWERLAAPPAPEYDAPPEDLEWRADRP